VVPTRKQNCTSASLNHVALFQQKSSGSIAWNAVGIRATGASVFPRESQASHYYFRTRDFRLLRSVSPQTTANNRKNFFSIVVSRPLRRHFRRCLAGRHIELLIRPVTKIRSSFCSIAAAKESPIAIIDLREGAVLDPPTLVLRSIPCRELCISLTSAGLYPEEPMPCSNPGKIPGLKKASRLIYISPALC